MRVLFVLLLCLVSNFAWAQTNVAPQIFVDVDADFLGNGAFLFCSSSDDAKLKPLTFAWSKVSGPGNVSWSAQNSRTTHARFSAKGLYILQCSVSDGQFTVTDKVTVLADQYADVAVRP
jgi:hypothetical protein